MFRPFLLVAALLAIPVAVSIPGPGDGASATQSRTGENCQRRNEGRRRGGAIAGAIGRSVLGRIGGGGAAAIMSPMGSMLGDAIMNLLDCDEQNKAATATEEVVEQAQRGGGVGTTTTWESETRPGVTGSSTVTSVERTAADDCMTVTDIVIIDGEETRAPKRMCRRPPSTRYVRV